MPTINDLKTSKFLRRSDVGKGMLVTITGVKEHNLAKDGAPEEWKLCLEFEETEKPMVLNNTNGQIIAGIFGTKETDDINLVWAGKQVVLYDDPNVFFGSERKGGLRVRAVKGQAKTDDLPF